jgi:hypothetical protein
MSRLFPYVFAVFVACLMAMFYFLFIFHNDLDMIWPVFL